MKKYKYLILTVLLAVSSLSLKAQTKTGWTSLFDGKTLKGWKQATGKATYEVKNGEIVGTTVANSPNSFLVTEKEYGDFELEFEWKLGKRGNSGCGLRFPDYGDPAFDGMELQMVDPRSYPPEMTVPPNELTGGLYRVVPPSAQALKPEAWNKYRVKMVGPKVNVELNGQKVLDLSLTNYTEKVKRHNDDDAEPLKSRPTKGRIGFQELSRDGGHVEIRNVRIRVLD